MDKPLRTFWGLLIGIIMLAAGLYAVSVLPGVGVAEHLAAYVRALWQRECLIEDQAVIFRTSALRKDIVARLIQGRLSLREASEALWDEMEGRPKHLRPGYVGPNPIQLDDYTRTVLAWVEVDLEGDPRRDEILNRLRAEMRANQEAGHLAPADTPRHPATATNR